MALIISSIDISFIRIPQYVPSDEVNMSGIAAHFVDMTSFVKLIASKIEIGNASDGK